MTEGSSRMLRKTRTYADRSERGYGSSWRGHDLFVNCLGMQQARHGALLPNNKKDNSAFLRSFRVIRVEPSVIVASPSGTSKRGAPDRLVRGVVKAFWSVALSGLVVGCLRGDRSTPTPGGEAPKELVLPGAPVMVGAGDIAVCGTFGDEATGRIVDSVLTADSAAKVETVVFTFGDNAYPSGPDGVDNYIPRCFSPSWGTQRIMKVIHPAPGNHDYDSGSGAPYFAYFGERAGPPGKGYYSYDVGEWHVISLNSELYFGHASPSEAREQENWLRRDLSDHRKLCALAYFHRPLFSSGVHGGTQEMRPLWRILYEGGVDVVLNGHEHDYERFRPQTPAGVADSAKGIEQIIAGTGGAQLRGVRYPLARNSVAQLHGHFGVLKLTLGAGEYRHAFLDTEGRIWDPGTRQCH